LHYK